MAQPRLECIGLCVFFRTELANLRCALQEHGSDTILLPASDDNRCDLCGDILNRCREPVRTALAEHRCVLVACWGGRNRAPAVAIGLLMIFDGLRLTEAVSDVVRCRGRVLSNMTFRRQLATLARVLREGG